jgi:hypothetical protein
MVAITFQPRTVGVQQETGKQSVGCLYCPRFGDFFPRHLKWAKTSNESKGMQHPLRAGIRILTSRAADVLQGTFQASFGFGSSTNFIDDSSLDPELRVIVKKLSKRDNITKQRALEELSEYLSQNMTSEFMETWEKLFQKLAIDHDRKVRENCFSVLKQIIQYDSKLLAPILKKVAGPWILGRFDSSKEVAQIATASFDQAFPSKLEQVLKVCQGVIIDYVSKMILEETPETLSDKRYVSDEDMIGKYNRCVSGSIDVVGFMIETLDIVTRKSVEDKYSLLFEKRFWEMAHHQQSTIRSAFYRFVTVCCRQGLDVMNTHKDLLARHYLSKVFLEKDSSIHPFMWDSLLLMSKYCTDVWLQEMKKPVVPKLLTFLDQGTFGSPTISYPCFLPLLAHVPVQLLKGHDHFVAKFLDSFWNGRIYVDKIHCQVFLNSFFECCMYFLRNESFSNEIDVVWTQYLLAPLESLSEKRSDRFSDQDVSRFCSKWLLDALSMSEVKDSVTQKWIQLAETSTNTIWILDLWTEMRLRGLNVKLVQDIVQLAVHRSIINGDVEMLHSLLVAPGLELPDEVVFKGIQLMKELEIESPKAPETFTLLISKCSPDMGQSASIGWSVLIAKATQSKSSVLCMTQVVKTIAAHPNPIFAPLIPLERYMLSLFEANEHTEQMELLLGNLLALDTSLLFDSAKEELIEMISAIFQAYLEQILIIPARASHIVTHALTEQTGFALKVLNVATRNGSNEFMTDLVHRNILRILLIAHSHPNSVASLYWEESNSKSVTQCIDEIRNLAAELSRKAQRLENRQRLLFLADAFVTEFTNLRHCASSADFVEIVADLFHLCVENLRGVLIQGILPSKDFFASEFGVLDTQSCITSIVDPVSIWARISPTPMHVIEHDHDGLSLYARWMLLLFALFKSTDTKEFVNLEYILELTRFAIICEDHLHTPTNLFESDLLAHTNLVLDDWKDLVMQQNREGFWSQLGQMDNVFGLAIHQCIASKFDIMGARILRKLIKTAIEEIDVTNQAIAIALDLYHQKNYVTCLALLEPMLPLCDVDLLDQCHPVFSAPVLKIKRSAITDASDPLLAQLIVFSNYLYGIKQVNADMDSGILTSIVRWVRTQYDAIVSSKGTEENNSHHMVVFDTQVARICDYLVTISVHEHIDFGLNMCRFLCDVGYYWIQLAKKITMDEIGKVYLFHTIQYWSTLEEAAEHSTMWTRVTDVAAEAHKIIVQLFFVVGEPTESTSVGLQALQTLIGDTILQLDHDDHLRQYLASESKLFSMLLTNCEQIQKTAFETLRRITYQRVQEYSLTIAMSSKKKKFGIPTALMDILTHSKPTETYQYFGFGLAWLLLFDHFHEANFDLRQMYIAELKESQILGRLLDIIFEVVGINSKKPLLNMKIWELDEYFVLGYDADNSSSIPLLYAHLFYKSMKTIPSLIRSWYSDCGNRQLVLSVESFTEKYIAPLLIAKEFETVQNQSDSEMTIRINTSQNEITAGYKIEEAGLDIVLKLPKIFPLKIVEVSSGTAGGRQAGIQESRWRSWLLSVSAVMVAQNGTILDALNLFKKNVNLHFEGMEDCAICYSIISAVDRSTPQKQCRVCKHIFHGSCVFKVIDFNVVVQILQSKYLSIVQTALLIGRHEASNCLIQTIYSAIPSLFSFMYSLRWTSV